MCASTLKTPEHTQTLTHSPTTPALCGDGNRTPNVLVPPLSSILRLSLVWKVVFRGERSVSEPLWLLSSVDLFVPLGSSPFGVSSREKEGLGHG